MLRLEVDSRGREHDGWTIHEHGPRDATHAVLLLPGGLCSSVFYDDLLAEPSLADAVLRFVATTLPGFGRTPAPADVSIENYARLAARLADDLGCDIVVGHSLAANVAIEMVASKAFSGPVVLISPAFSREDEVKFLGVLDRLAVVFGHLPYSLMLKMIGPAMKKIDLPPARREALVADLQNNDPRFVRREMRAYLEHLDSHGSLADRLCDSGVPAWVVFGEHDDTKLSEDERRVLEACSPVTLVTIPGVGHLAHNERPDRIAELVLAAVSSLR